MRQCNDKDDDGGNDLKMMIDTGLGDRRAAEQQGTWLKNQSSSTMASSQNHDLDHDLDHDHDIFD